jgi:hypothetical protein
MVFTSAAPALDDVTSTWKVHEPLAGTVPPVSVTLPAFCVTLPPAHVVDAFGVAAVVSPDGYVSVTDVTVMAAPFGLPIVTVSVDTPPGSIVPGEKDFATVGDVAVTVSVAVFETAPVDVWLLETPEVVLGFAPAVVPRTTTVTVHDSAAGTLSPLKASADWFALKLLPPAPAHVPAAAPAASITMPESESVNAAPVSAKELGFVMVKVSVLVPPRGTVAGENALLMDGGEATASEADAALPAGASLLVAVLVVFVTGVFDVTACVMVHVAPGGMAAALNPTELPPLAPPVSVALPELHDTEPAAALVSPAG